MKKKWLIPLRIVLAVLIALNLAVIFGFSGETAAKSSKTSGSVTEKIAEVVVPDFDQKPAEEQKEIVKKMEPPIRKLAHFSEYASLGALIFLFLLTWNGAVLWKYAGSVAFSAAYSVTDELHQKFSFGRAASIRDMVIDTAGALVACSLLLLIRFLVLRAQKRPKKLATTIYTISSKKIEKPLRFAVVADLHGHFYESLPGLLQAATPDAILIPGDLTKFEDIAKNDEAIFDFLRICSSIAPTYYSLGNHELGTSRHGNLFAKPHKKELPASFSEKVTQTGAILLRNDCVLQNGIWFCGLDSGFDGSVNSPDTEALAKFDACPGFRVLLCHHPEYFVPFVQKTSIDLTVCGHAHGGHWRFFGRGLYAPDQGLFPKYTSGVLNGRCVISRGLGDHTKIPRFNNRRELVLIDLTPEKE